MGKFDKSLLIPNSLARSNEEVFGFDLYDLYHNKDFLQHSLDHQKFEKHVSESTRYCPNRLIS